MISDHDLQWYDDPVEWCIDIVGLVLNIPFSVWDHMTERFSRIRLFDRRSVFDTVAVRRGFPIPLRQPLGAIPSLAVPSDAAAAQLVAPKETMESSFFRNQIVEVCSRPKLPLITSAHFTCFAALLEFELERRSPNVPRFTNSQLDSETLPLGYYHWPAIEFFATIQPAQETRVSMRLLWLQLTNELEMYKTLSANVTRYVREHFPELKDGEEIILGKTSRTVESTSVRFGTGGTPSQGSHICLQLCEKYRDGRAKYPRK